MEPLNVNNPPGRRSRATSGIVRYGSVKLTAPQSQKTMSNPASGSGTASALACRSGKSTPASRMRRRACASCASETSSPTGRAPSRARAIDHWAAPQPSSRISFPRTSPRICSSASGTCHTPQARPARGRQLGPVIRLVLGAVAVPAVAIRPSMRRETVRRRAGVPRSTVRRGEDPQPAPPCR